MISPEREPDPYWNDERELGEVFVGHAYRPVWARSHIAEEVFRGRGSETLFTLTKREGPRTYVQSHLLLPSPLTPGREFRLADAQAWHYPADRTIVLWELLIAPQYERQPDPREHLLLRSLWLHYEGLLAARFPTADQLLTTWEDSYPREQWAGFLRTIGYHEQGLAVFAKPLAARHP